MKTRTDLGKTKNSFLTLYNKGVKDFLEYLLSCECQLFQYLVDVLQNISSYTPELRDDYTYLMALNPLDLLKTHNADNLEDCLLLAYSLLDKTLPNLVKNLQQHHDAVKKRFTLLRQSINKKSEYKLQATVKPTNDKQIQAKLQETLACSVNNLSIILEKSQNLLDILEHTNQTDLSEISNAVIDLRNHSFATYESLDLICKLYGILANSSTNNQSQKRLSEVKQDGNVEPNFTIINCDDANEPLEENFELYIGDDDLTNDDSTTKYECERTDEYISLMLRELRQSLRQHQRFIDAKNRRGSDDDEEVVKKNSCVELRKSPPKFNLSVLKDSLEINDVSSTSSLDSDQRKDMPLHAPIPPPPPPPLPLPPSFQLDDLETESGQVNARSMLDNIKTLSSQRNVQEDVFGDSDVDSNSSDD
ncbi:hypothetical protein NQ318_018402 [Aromia moschata]|uniref:Uncharacterized protein n=1 Tax=Aromia moschata TaxID=1265417 RepID=A0AAV8XT48_9CUCU|nr:hypothetical protein NQ318_018402 [Aromia moschata]